MANVVIGNGGALIAEGGLLAGTFGNPTGLISGQLNNTAGNHNGTFHGYSQYTDGTYGVPYVREDGVMEVGQILDFHSNGQTLDFNGRLLCNSDGSFVFQSNLGSFSNITANGFYVGSSREIKRDIEESKINALDTINQVKVVDFKYKGDKSDTPKIGFIAEDTPSILSSPDNDKMDTTNCIGVLLKAVQELNNKIIQLQRMLK